MKPAGWIGLAIILGALVFGARAFVTNLTPYVPFAEARKALGQVQVMGTLDKASIRNSAKSLEFVLVAKDNPNERMPVRFTAARPANFEEAVEVTAIGKFDGQVFQADNLLVKCPSKYQGTETKEYASGKS